MTDEAATDIRQITMRLGGDRSADLDEHIAWLRERLPASSKVTPTMAMLDLFDRGVADRKRVSRDKARAR